MVTKNNRRLTPAMREYLRVLAELGPDQPVRKYAEAAGRSRVAAGQAFQQLAANGYVRATKLRDRGHSYAITAKGAREVAR